VREDRADRERDRRARGRRHGDAPAGVAPRARQQREQRDERGGEQQLRRVRICQQRILDAVVAGEEPVQQMQETVVDQGILVNEG